MFSFGSKASESPFPAPSHYGPSPWTTMEALPWAFHHPYWQLLEVCSFRPEIWKLKFSLKLGLKLNSLWAKTRKLTNGYHLGGQILVVIFDLLDVGSSQFGMKPLRTGSLVVVIMRRICSLCAEEYQGLHTFGALISHSYRWAAPSQKYVRGWVIGLAQKNHSPILLILFLNFLAG